MKKSIRHLKMLLVLQLQTTRTSRSTIPPEPSPSGQAHHVVHLTTNWTLDFFLSNSKFFLNFFQWHFSSKARTTNFLFGLCWITKKHSFHSLSAFTIKLHFSSGFFVNSSKILKLSLDSCTANHFLIFQAKTVQSKRFFIFRIHF